MIMYVVQEFRTAEKKKQTRMTIEPENQSATGTTVY